MKTLALIMAALCLAIVARASSTINATNRYAYGANVAWMDWRGDDGTNGAVIGEFVCSGYIYGANIGWIHLGNGSPTNHVQYSNTATNDYGVNHDGAGNLSGYAYGANVGWLNFEAQGAPKIDLRTGNLSGYVYGANIGWISLSNAFAFVQTDSLDSRPGYRRRRDSRRVGVSLRGQPEHDERHDRQRRRWDERHCGVCGRYRSIRRQRLSANHGAQRQLGRIHIHGYLDEPPDTVVSSAEPR